MHECVLEELHATQPIPSLIPRLSGLGMRLLCIEGSVVV